LGFALCTATLFGLYNIGYSRDRWADLQVAVRAHGPGALGGPVAMLRGYFSRYEDEQLYFAYGALANGQPVPAAALAEWQARRPDLAQLLPPSHALVPYRDFSVEYPPLATLAFAACALPSGGDFDRFKWAWSLLMEIAVLLSVVMALRARSRLVSDRSGEENVTLYAALAIFLIGPIVLVRMDALAVVWVAAALLAAAGGKRTLAGALLGLGFATKLFPAVALPALLAPAVARRQFGHAARITLAFAACAVLPFVPVIVSAPHAWTDLFTYHARRGLHVESVLATPILVAAAAGAKASLAQSFGSWNIEAPGSHLALVLATLGTLGLPLLVAGLLFRHAHAHGRAVDGSASGAGDRELNAVTVGAMGASLAAAVVCGKVLSFQYVLWLLPSALLAGAGQAMARGRTARVLFALIALLGQALFPYGYAGVLALRAAPVALLGLRNLLLIAFAVALVWPLLPRRAAASSLVAVPRGTT
jgi:hypothetical protein